ncbi:MAG: MarR family winged helix-turn-helix transcriptional regulator [Flavobacteriales bacterium]
MGIEQDIHQKNFKSIHQKCYINLMYTTSILNALHTKELKKFDLSPQQFNLLRILRGQHPKAVNLNDVACRMIDKSSNASRLVEKLRLKNLVTRITSKEDRRAVEIGITKQGLELLDSIDKIEANFFKPLQNLTLDEAEILSQMLDKIRS